MPRYRGLNCEHWLGMGSEVNLPSQQEAKGEPNSLMAKKCFHKENYQTYVQWHLDAEHRMKAGEKQTQCPVCKRYVWKSDYKLKEG